MSFMCGRLDDEPSGDFGIGHIGDHRLEVGAGLGGLDCLGTIEVGDVLEASNKALLGSRLEILNLLNGITANLGDDAGGVLLPFFNLHGDVYETVDGKALVGHKLPALDVGGADGLGELLGDGLGGGADKVDEGATSVTFVAGFADHLAVDEDGRGEADGFFAHPLNGLERLEGEAGEGGGGVGCSSHVVREAINLAPPHLP